MKPIGTIKTDFPTKFGLPRQSGIVETPGQISFYPPYNNPDAVRGLEEFSHIWILWQFSENLRDDDQWFPTVRPPRLGGNVRKGVFATRSPFRPNPIGLSCVKLERVEITEDGPILHILGADLMDGTPIYDIKPYIPYADCHPEATGSFSDAKKGYHLEVEIGPDLLEAVPEDQRELLLEILGQDPRPSYHDDPARVYGMEYGGLEIKFTVAEGVLWVVSIERV